MSQEIIRVITILINHLCILLLMDLRQVVNLAKITKLIRKDLKIWEEMRHRDLKVILKVTMDKIITTLLLITIHPWIIRTMMLHHRGIKKKEKIIKNLMTILLWIILGILPLLTICLHLCKQFLLLNKIQIMQEQKECKLCHLHLLKDQDLNLREKIHQIPILVAPTST